MSEVPAKRHWFRFSLRTLFVVLTALACWLGYEWNWIRQRRELIASEHVLVWGAIRAPGLLWLLGEPGYSEAAVLVADPRILSPEDRADMARAVQLFPEASMGYIKAPARE